MKNKEPKWYHPLSHWAYFIIFISGQAVVVLLLWAHAIESAFHLDFTSSFKALALIQFIYILLTGLFFVFRLIGRTLWLDTA